MMSLFLIGFLPLTGSWSDTKILMQTSWTFRGSGNRLTRKHVIMKIERLPIEQEIASKDYFGKQKSETGYLWKGTITIYMKKCPKGMTIRNIYDCEGEDFFNGEEKDKQTINNNDDVKDNDDTKGNGAVKIIKDDDKESNKGNNNEVPLGNIETEKQVYCVELVLSKEDPAGDKDKDLKKRILSAMSSSLNTSTPR